MLEEAQAEYIYYEQDRYAALVAESDFHERIARVKGDAFREYRRQWDSAGRFEEETPVPLHLDIQLTTACNYRCRMCPFGMPKAKRPVAFNAVNGSFPLKLFRKVIDEGASLGLKALDLSYYNEPLLRDDLMSFIDYADDRGVLDIMLSTNGELLNPGVSDRLLDSGITRFLISLDATTKATFEKIRIGGNFETVIRNLRYFLKRKSELGRTTPITRASFLKTKLNEDELGDFVSYWKPRVDYLSIQELNKFEGLTDELFPRGRIRNAGFRCHQPWHRLAVRPNGDVLPCCTAWGLVLVVGNLNSQSLTDIWNGPMMRNLRLLHSRGRYQEHPVCRECAVNSTA